MRRGMTLIEILIASVIASMMSTGLLLTIIQINNAQRKLLDVVSQYERVATVMQNMERDIMGAFIPLQAIPLPKPKPVVSNVPSQSLAPVSKKQPKPIDNVFYGTEINGQFDTLTFITNNPISFMEARNSKLKPRIVRVVYRLQQDIKRKNSFNLIWQEGTNLNFSAYTKDAKNELRSYTMIEGIARMQVHYIMLDPEKNKDTKDTQPQDGDRQEKKKPKKRIYKKVKQWKQKKDEKQKKIQLPEAVEITLELWDSMYETKNSFSFVVPLVGELVVMLPDEKKDVKPSEQSAEPGAGKQEMDVALVVSQPPQLPPHLASMYGAGAAREHTLKNDVSWLDRVTVREGSSLMVNGEKYVPGT